MNSFAVYWRNIVISFCFCVCPRAYLRSYMSDLQQFLLVLLAVARSCSGGVVIRYVFPVLRLTSYVCIK